MDTRWRNIRYSAWFKLAAVLIGICGVIVSFFGILNGPDFEYGVQSSDYIKSETYMRKISGIRNKIDLLWNAGMLFDDQNTGQAQGPGAEVQNRDWLKSIKKELEETEGLYYAVVLDGAAYGKNPDFFNSLPDFQKFEGPNERLIYIGFEKDAIAKQAEEFTAKRQNGLKGIYMFAGGLLLSMLSMLWLMYTAGRTRKNDGITLNTLDRIYLDIGICLAAIIFGILIWAWSSVMSKWYQSFQDSPVFYIESIALLSAAYIVALVYFVSLSKRFKRGEILKHTLIAKLTSALIRLLKKLFEGVRKGLDAGPLAVKAAAFLLVYSIGGGLACLLVLYFVASSTDLILGVILAVCVYILATFIAFRFITSRLSGFIALADGIKKIKNGMLTYKIPPCGSHTIDSIADDINNISEGLSAAVENEMKSERMKVELITNVSHDLRTPLTSIITYTDLLSQDNVTPEQAKEYIAILKDKSDKLKRLVDDLFEVSKSESGLMDVELKALNLNDLLAQSLAEYSDAFENGRLEVITKSSRDKIMVMADGSKMWRVISNILNNAVKYSMPGTRVYIDLETDDRNAFMTFKNISNYAMNFTPDEIFERFVRGDKSRSSSGSGLGLAIVRSFMSIQKGKCDLSVDGDLFKLKIALPLA